MKYSNETYIEKANKIHNNKYDYSLLKYDGVNKKIKIICPVHGEFEQIANQHLKGSGCRKCFFDSKRLNYDEIFKKANKIHKNKFKYLKPKEYKNNNDIIKIICPVHGEFEQKVINHLKGRGCPKCGGTKKLTKEEYIEKANKIHNNKYDYSLLKYDGVNKKIKIICPVHGEFEQIADNHIRKKYGCPKCVGKGLNKEEYIKKFNFIFLNKYDYILLKKLIKYNSIIKVICPIHGEFETKPYIHIRGHGCPKCKESKGEREIRLFLENNNIKFDYQFKFKKCKNKKELPFDFFVKDLNLCIEFDGEQHFKAFEIFGGEKKFKEIKINDNIKNNFCKQNNINLIRISYKDIKNINEILWKEINKKK